MNDRLTTLFLDVGGVLLTNGWDSGARKRASRRFGLNYAELDRRHTAVLEEYETGKVRLEEYLARVVFHQSRTFEPAEFKTFMLSQSRRLPGMIDLVRSLRGRPGLKVVLVSNEGRELTEHRIERFRLRDIADLFIVSCFVGLRKPNVEIYRLALDVSQSFPTEVLYIDDRKNMTEVGEKLGITSIHHKGFEHTKGALETLGFRVATPELSPSAHGKPTRDGG